MTQHPKTRGAISFYTDEELIRFCRCLHGKTPLEEELVDRLIGACNDAGRIRELERDLKGMDEISYRLRDERDAARAKIKELETKTDQLVAANRELGDAIKKRMEIQNVA